MGIVLGIIASFGAARLLRSQLDLFQAPTADPVSFPGMVLLFSAVAALACFVPARRAARIDPMEVLRYE